MQVLRLAGYVTTKEALRVSSEHSMSRLVPIRAIRPH
jgi:hypothetical protein